MNHSPKINYSSWDPSVTKPYGGDYDYSKGAGFPGMGEIPRPWETPYAQPMSHNMYVHPHHSIHASTHSIHPAQQALQWIEHAKKHIDRLGGIEGLVNSATKIHHVIKQIQQAAPLVQLLISGLRSNDHQAEEVIEEHKEHKEHKEHEHKEHEHIEHVREPVRIQKRKPIGTKSKKRRMVD